MLDEQINVVFPASYSDELIILVIVSIYYVYAYMHEKDKYMAAYFISCDT